MVQRTMYRCVVLQICRFHDGSENLCLKTVGEICQEPEAVRKEYDARMQALGPAIGPVRRWRDKLVAHRDRETAAEGAAVIRAPGQTEITRALERIHAVLNIVREHRFGYSTMPTLLFAARPQAKETLAYAWELIDGTKRIAGLLSKGSSGLDLNVMDENLRKLGCDAAVESVGLAMGLQEMAERFSDVTEDAVLKE